MVNMIDNIVWTIRYGSYHLIAGDFSWRSENISPQVHQYKVFVT